MVPIPSQLEATYYAGGLLAAYIVVCLSFRLLLHPLRNYPGPFWARFTDLYAGFHAINGGLHLATLNNHGMYGPVVRTAPNRLVFNTITALRDIYQNDRITKSHLYLLSQQSPNTYNIFNAVPRDVHNTRRRLIGQAVNERSMRKFEPIMKTQVDIFLKELLRSTQGSDRGLVNISERCRYLGIDIAALLGFGQSFQLQTDEKYRFIPKSFDLGAWNGWMQLQFPLLAKLKTRTLMNLLFFKTRLKAFRMIERIIKDRLALEKDAKHDLYSIVADSIGTGNDSIRQTDLWSEALFFLTAGGDTTATALSATFFYLSRNPSCYQILANEIRSTFKNGDEIVNGPTLIGCRYLRACIDEALRMSPPVTGTPWRELYADDDRSKPLVIDGHVIPEGTQVGVNIYALHHNESYFKNSFSYNPERWMIPDSPLLLRDAFAPFSIGSRGCAGKAMAYLEASLVLAKTFWYFDFEVPKGDAAKLGAGKKGNKCGRHREDEYQLYDAFSALHDGPNLVFHPREVSQGLRIDM